jgi:hypothetical protein
MYSETVINSRSAAVLTASASEVGVSPAGGAYPSADKPIQTLCLATHPAGRAPSVSFRVRFLVLEKFQPDRSEDVGRSFETGAFFCLGFAICFFFVAIGRSQVG